LTVEVIVDCVSLSYCVFLMIYPFLLFKRAGFEV